VPPEPEAAGDQAPADPGPPGRPHRAPEPYRPPARYQPPGSSASPEPRGSAGSYRPAESYQAPEPSAPDPYGTPGSYRVPESHQPSTPDPDRPSGSGYPSLDYPGSSSYRAPSGASPPTGSYRVPGYYRAPEAAAETYPAPESGPHDEPLSWDAPDDTDTPEAWEPPSSPSYDLPSYDDDPDNSYPAPEESHETSGPYSEPERYEPPGRSGSADSTDYSDDDYGALGRYGESGGDRGPEDADAGAPGDRPVLPRRDDDDDYDGFWREERRGGGVHSTSSRTSAAKPAPVRVRSRLQPGWLGATWRRPDSPRRQMTILVGVAAVIVAAAVIAIATLLFHPKHPYHAAGNPPSSTPSSGGATSSPAGSTPVGSLASTGAHGHLGVPSSVGSLHLNPTLTGKFVGASARRTDASSFRIPGSDVVSGFYTTDASATKFTTKDPRLMFEVAYLSGGGNAKSALHGFLTNHMFTRQKQISAGKLGGVAACGLLPEKSGPVSHCMWADGSTYADFYAWDSNPAALAKTMIAIRPHVEIKR